MGVSRLGSSLILGLGSRLILRLRSSLILRLRGGFGIVLGLNRRLGIIPGLGFRNSHRPLLIKESIHLRDHIFKILHGTSSHRYI
jgi:hypothetical protein